MALDFGWQPNDVRETIWKGDNSLANVPVGALEDWAKDADASHLRPYCTGGKPEVFTYRALEINEARYVTGLNAESDWPGYLVQLLECFRIGVDFPDAPTDGTIQSTGQQVRRNERVRGMRMLDKRFCHYLERRNPGIIGFYGTLIFKASFPSEEEKKASSPPSITTPSSAAESTTAGTAEAGKAAEAAA